LGLGRLSLLKGNPSQAIEELTLAGMPFRDAYKTVGLAIENGDFTPNKNIAHTHEGSVGNLCNNEIVNYKNEILKNFNFDKMQNAEKSLID
jgi:argininosuccinate lyase